MRSWTVTHASWLLVTVCALLLVAACSSSSPVAEEKAAAPDHGRSQPPEPKPLAGATPAPGSEQFNPDEHPELAHVTEVTIDSLAEGITNYVQTESARRGGLFPVDDPEQRTSLGLTLMSVHRERLSQLADGRYFACADFKGRDGHTYDVDIFMRRESTGLTPTDVIVHKQDGKARFDWVERNGTWSQAPLTAR